MRLILAATLSSSYGIYSGYELCDNTAIPGSEEYLNSEKYEIKVRDWKAPGNIVELVTKINRLRHKNSALQECTNLTFLETDNDQILSYAKMTKDRSNIIIVVVNLDPYKSHEGTVQVSPELFGMGHGASYQVRDLLTDTPYTWQRKNYVNLDPRTQPAHIFRLET